MTSVVNRERTNEQWLQELGAEGKAKDAALADLRRLLILGLKKGLGSWLRGHGRGADTLIEDFTHEALLKILSNMHTFQGNSQFVTWAHKTAVREALTELRRRQWRDVSLDKMFEENSSSLPSLTDKTTIPEHIAEKSDIMDILGRMIREELSDKQRRAMVAVVYHDVPLDEVARRMDMNRNALYKLLHDARLKLKRRLVRDGFSVGELLAVFENR